MNNLSQFWIIEFPELVALPPSLSPTPLPVSLPPLSRTVYSDVVFTCACQTRTTIRCASDRLSESLTFAPTCGLTKTSSSHTNTAFKKLVYLFRGWHDCSSGGCYSDSDGNGDRMNRRLPEDGRSY